MNENIKAKKRNNEKVYLTEANINKLKGLDKERSTLTLTELVYL
jgi:hypothetical protein